ncbi:MAG: acyltransferase [Promethearchaeota archaeon]
MLNKIIFIKNNVKHSNFKINGILFVRNGGEIKIGKNFIANSGIKQNPIGGDTILRLIVKKGGQLIIGDNVGISNSTIVCWNKVEIGNYVMIGGGCKIWDTNFHSLNPIIRTSGEDNDIKTAPIKIKDYAFIGGGSIILKGVTIGKNSIVAAGSVVVKDIPDNEIWGGNPAIFIKKLDKI